MRNLKRVLALALALVMVIGMMVMGASAASYSDAADISADYEEAVAVMSGVGMFKGDDQGNLNPAEVLTQKEAATLLARLMLGATTADKLIATKQIFSDVAVDEWYAPYVEYCYQAGLIAGNGKGEFNPDAQLTGIAFAKLILVAMGYDASAQGYVGADWASNIAVDALNAGLKVDDVVLSAYVTRELAAQMLFQALDEEVVKYTTAYDYATGAQVVVGPNTNTKYDDFADKYFPGLVKTGAGNDAEWGRPYSYAWVYGTSTLYIAWEAAAAEYWTAVTECQIASDIGLATKTGYTMYTNGVINPSAYEVQPLDTVQTIGAQGTKVEVYKTAKVIVVIDTFLAEVTKVTPVTYDAAGHKANNATLTLTVYDGSNTSVQLEQAANYSYTVGQYLLVNAYTNNTVNTTTGDVTVNKVYNTTGYQYVDIIGEPTALVGAQTLIWQNVAQHTINGTTYSDAKWFKLDQAGTEVTNHTWLFDQKGNVIGAVDLETVYTYAILENIQWVNPLGAAGYALGTIRYMDGTTESKVIAAVDGNPTDYALSGTVGVTSNVLYIATDIAANVNLCGKDLYLVSTVPGGAVALTHVTHTDGTGASAVTYKSELTSATIKGNSVLASLAAISGTPATGDNCKVIYTNSNTTFLVRSLVNNSYVYTVVVGYENMASYTGAGVAVDYVDKNKDGYADLVYVTGNADTAAGTWNLFMPTSNNVSWVLKANGTVDYYVVTGILNGEKNVSIKVTNEGAKDLLIGNLNKMCLVFIKGGKVIDDAGATNWSADTAGVVVVGDVSFDGVNGYPGNYAALSMDYQAASTAGTTTWNGQVMKVGSAYYNVVGLTPVVGSFAADMSTKSVYVIYDDTYSFENTYIAKAVYIIDAANSDVPSGDGSTDPVTGTWVQDSGAAADWWYNNETDELWTADVTETIGDLATAYSGSVYYSAPNSTIISAAANNAAVNAMTIKSALASGYAIYLSNANGFWTVVPTK